MTDAILLTGTPILPDPVRILRAGSLTAVLDCGGLRWIRWNSVEILRGILFLVRTPGWGTAAAQLHDVSIEETDADFTVSYRARYDGGLEVEVRMQGLASGTLTAEALITTEIAFQTNRTGFVVLHPLDGVAGTEVSVTHASAPARRLTLPPQISPGQPVMDIAAITHQPVPDLSVETRFSGDIFEMEDHRNWSDASFKTYSRPIGLPYPYALTPGEPVTQSVTLTVQDGGANGMPATAVIAPQVMDQVMPRFALPLDHPEAAAHAVRHADAVAALAPQALLLRVDMTDAATLADFEPLAALLRLTGAELELQAIVSAADGPGAGAELAALAKALAKAGVSPTHVSAFAKVDEASFQPGQPRPPHPPEAELAEALARHFPQARRIGGTPAFFTELNRKRPVSSLWQGLTFATSPVVHAADDPSVMETLESLPHIMASAAALAPGLPLSVGPVGIGMRLNPYGDAPVQNDPDARVEMAARDPRQRGLMAAAFTVGYLARIAAFGIDRFAFGAPSGPFSLISTPQDYPRPIWDDQPDGAPYPLYHVGRWIAGAAGARLITAETRSGIAHLCWTSEDRRSALLANLGAEPKALPDGDLPTAAVLLDAGSVLALSSRTNPDPTGPLPAMLSGYAVLFMTEEA